MGTVTASDPWTLGQMARAAGAQEWQLRSLLRRGLIAEPPRCGPFRVFDPAGLPVIVAALVSAGYRGEQPAAAG
jgi:hypothetical protein